MPKVYIIHGFTGAGKTTFSKKMAHETGAIRFNIDEAMYATYGENPPSEKFSEYYSMTESSLLIKAQAALRSGKDVIFDYGFWTYQQREKYRQFALLLNADPILYALEADEKTMEERVLNRTAQRIPSELVIDLNAIQKFRKIFESLRPDEIFVKVSSDV